MSSLLVSDGLHAGLSFADYQALPAWGASSLRAMRRGPPARVLWEQKHREDTDSTVLGSAVHCALLTPELLETSFALRPDGMDFRSKEGRAWRDDPCRAGLPVLTSDRVALVRSICAAIQSNRTAAAVLDASDLREASVVWTDPTTGEACKGRLDFSDGEYLYDLKLSRHAEAPTLDYRAYVDGWMHQAAHYLSGLAAVGMDLRGARLVVVGPRAPHYVRCLQVKPGAIDLCTLDNEAALSALKSCRESGEWPGHPEEWVFVEPPAFALGEASVTFSGIEEE